MKPKRTLVYKFMTGVLSNFKKAPTVVDIVDCSNRKVSRQELSSYVFRPTPVVLKGMLSQYPMRRWSFSYFKELDSAQPTSPRVSVARTNVEQAASLMQDMPLKEFIQYVEDLDTSMKDETAIPQCPSLEVPALIDPSKYVYCNEEKSLVSTHFPELREQLQHIRAIFPRWMLQEYSLWLGPRGAVTGLHADHDYNSLIQCQGKKTMLFIPSSEEHLVYKSLKFDAGATLSKVDLRRPRYNATHFPLMKDATAFVAHLEPGDLICIPRKWYHFVVCTEGPSVSCTLHCNSLPMKAMENLQKVGHRLGLHGWTEEGCTCHNA